MNALEIEQASRAAWPALEEQELEFGVLRYARGADRRTNSLSLHPNARSDAAEIIGTTEKFFTARTATPIVKIVQPSDSNEESLRFLDSVLEDEGYHREAPTQSMLLDLKENGRGLLGKTCEQIPHDELPMWLDAWYEITGRSLESLPVHRATLRDYKFKRALLVKRQLTGDPICTGMAVSKGNAVGLFGIATDSNLRGQGHAESMVRALLNWALVRGVRYAYLQVEDSNVEAINLYKKLGFKKLYSYWYRVGTKTFCRESEKMR